MRFWCRFRDFEFFVIFGLAGRKNSKLAEMPNELEFDESVFALDNTSEELLKQLGEDPNKIQNQLTELRTWIQNQDKVSCRFDDEFLKKFLRVAKFDVEAARQRLTRICAVTGSKNDDLFLNLSAHDPGVRRILELGIVYIMPKPDHLGRVVFVTEGGKLQGVKFDPNDFLRTVVLVATYAVFHFERSQIHGVVNIQNGSTMSKEVIAYWTPGKIRRCMQIWQALPCLMRATEIYNLPKVVRLIWDTAQAILKPKMRDRVKVFSDARMTDTVPLDCRPRALGGECVDWELLKHDFIRKLEQFQPELDSLLACKVIDKKHKKAKDNSWGISAEDYNE